MTSADGAKPKKPKTRPGTRAKQRRPAKKTRTYKEAGVDIAAGAEFVRRISPLVQETFNSRVITDIGGFSGLYSFDPAAYEHPVLVCSTDGVGSKLKLAFQTGIHHTVGLDLVAMCVNDILVQGARPLFFLDYLAVGRLEPDQAVKIMEGIVAGCREAQCPLLGGETAELPDFYPAGEYDLAGFVVGVVDADKIIDGSEIAVGDQIIGLASSGLHSNGFTLVRRLLLEDLKMKLSAPFEDHTLGEELLRPTRIYVNTVRILLRNVKVSGIAHITGGGFPENVPRILPQGCQAVVRKEAWARPAIFDFIQESGGVAEEEMFRTFNMGVGLVLIVGPEQAQEMLERLGGMQEQAFLIGEITRRPEGEPPLVLV